MNEKVHKIIETENLFSIFDAPITNTKPIKSTNIETVYDFIKWSVLKSITEEIRNCHTKEQQTKLKINLLPFAAFAVTCSYRNEKGIITRSGYIALDIDHVDGHIEQVWNTILAEFTPALMFRSPGGNGIKVICRIDIVGEHKAYFKALQEFFLDKLQIIIDPRAGLDQIRACFLCHDPNAFMSITPTVFDQEFIQLVGDTEHAEIYRRCKKWIDGRSTFTVGNRHNYIVELTGVLNRAGLPMNFTIKKLNSFSDDSFGVNEIHSIVKKIYQQSEFIGINPMTIKQKPGKEAYTTFPLKLLWVPRDQFLPRIKEILAGSYDNTSHDVPTSLKTAFLKDTIEGKISPELLLFLAAIKSIIGHRNFTKTTREYIEQRMFNSNPWRKCTRTWFDNLLNGAFDRKFMSKISCYRGYYISICYDLPHLDIAVTEWIKKQHDGRNKLRENSRIASKNIAALKNKLRRSLNIENIPAGKPSILPANLPSLNIA